MLLSGQGFFVDGFGQYESRGHFDWVVEPSSHHLPELHVKQDDVFKVLVLSWRLSGESEDTASEIGSDTGSLTSISSAFIVLIKWSERRSLLLSASSSPLHQLLLGSHSLSSILSLSQQSQQS